MGHVVFFSSVSVIHPFPSYHVMLPLVIKTFHWIHHVAFTSLSEAVIDGDSMVVRQGDSISYTDMIDSFMGKKSRSRSVSCKADVKACKQFLKEEVTPTNHAYSLLCSTRPKGF